MLIDALLALLAAWVALASFRGAWRFAFPPLRIAGAGMLLISIALALYALDVSIAGFFSLSGFCCTLWYAVRHAGELRRRQISLRQLLLFV
jgi:hypothetical protein